MISISVCEYMSVCVCVCVCVCLCLCVYVFLFVSVQFLISVVGTLKVKKNIFGIPQINGIMIIYVDKT